VNFFLVSLPGEYSLDAIFDGNDSYSQAGAGRTFEITEGASLIVLTPKSQSVQPDVSTQVSATVTSSGLPLVGKPAALTVESGGVRVYTSVVMTDYAGRASWQVPGQAAGSYDLKAWFGLPVSTDLDLSSSYYTGSSDTASLSVTAGKTNLHVNANDKTITYGDTAPSFGYAFTAADVDPRYPTTEITSIICSAGSGPFTHAGSPYTDKITCTGGISAHYNLIYLPGTLTVAGCDHPYSGVAVLGSIHVTGRVVAGLAGRPIQPGRETQMTRTSAREASCIFMASAFVSTVRWALIRAAWAA
jgi:hypothetical protein